jgi:hypothetical protein
MKPASRAAALVVAWALFLSFAGAEPPRPLFDGCRWWFPGLCEQWRQRRCWCPDDYCPKALPQVSPVPCGCTDDYCPKPLPCVPRVPCGCVDDYCPKGCPIALPRTCEPWYTCGPACKPPAPVRTLP